MTTEADTCRKYIVPNLHNAGWEDENIAEQLVLTPGRIIPLGEKKHTRKDGLRADYVLYIKKNIPIAVVEAKAEYMHAAQGLQQAMQYAEMLNVQFAYSSNGLEIVEHDYLTGRETTLSQFPRPDELWARLRGKWNLQRDEDAKDALTAYFEEIGGKTPRYYQQAAINLAVAAVISGQKRILLTMATGTGKTFVAFQIVWRLWKAGRKKRILYLADRNILIDQAKDLTFSPMGQALHKIRGQALKSREVYFAIYQALDSPTSTEKLYKQYPRDFFDLIIVDECHRGSARDESNWRKILEYFKPAQQIGMTATPKRKDNVDTYQYFGNPIYTYSLKQGIEDGFLAPYRVYRVIPDIDATGLIVDSVILDRFGREVPPGLYGTKEFERIVSLLSRTETVAKHLTDAMKRTNRMDKTIVFCVDQEHALDMRKALKNANSDLVRTHPHYVERVVSDEGKFGRSHLDDFQDPENDTPVILTTSQMLTTGVDAPTCRNIVLFKPISSMTDFKQIIGRGTRVLEERGKYWFTIYDYVGATKLFYDKAFDGDPVQLIQTVIDIEGNEVDTLDSDEGDVDGQGQHKLKDGDGSQADDKQDENGDDEPTRKKYYLDNVTVYIMGEQAYELDPDENILRTVQYTDYVKENIRKLNLTAEHLRQSWSTEEQRQEITTMLRSRGIDPEHLSQVTHHPEVDALDLLLNVAFNAPLVSRKERAIKLRQKKQNFLNTFTPAAREILDILLDKYADFGIGEFDNLISALQVPPFSEFGTPLEIAERFGGPLEMRHAIDQVQSLLFE